MLIKDKDVAKFMGVSPEHLSMIKHSTKAKDIKKYLAYRLYYKVEVIDKGVTDDNM